MDARLAWRAARRARSTSILPAAERHAAARLAVALRDAACAAWCAAAGRRFSTPRAAPTFAARVSGLPKRRSSPLQSFPAEGVMSTRWLSRCSTVFARVKHRICTTSFSFVAACSRFAGRVAIIRRRILLRSSEATSSTSDLASSPRRRRAAGGIFDGLLEQPPRYTLQSMEARGRPGRVLPLAFEAPHAAAGADFPECRPRCATAR